MEIQEIRRKILEVLYEAYHGGSGRGEIERSELAQQLKLSPKQLQSSLDYLLNKNYVQAIPASVGPRTLTFLQITSDGIDLVEGHTRDVEVVYDVGGDLYHVGGDLTQVEVGPGVQNVAAGKGVSQHVSQITGDQLDALLDTFLSNLHSQSALSASDIERVTHQVQGLQKSLRDLELT